MGTNIIPAGMGFWVPWGFLQSVFSRVVSPHTIPQGSEMLNEMYHSDAEEEI